MLKDLHSVFESFSFRLAVTVNTAIFCIYTFVLSSLSFLTFMMVVIGDITTASITAPFGQKSEVRSQNSVVLTPHLR